MMAEEEADKVSIRINVGICRTSYILFDSHRRYGHMSRIDMYLYLTTVECLSRADVQPHIHRLGCSQAPRGQEGH
jgi:hypothetical protein